MISFGVREGGLEVAITRWPWLDRLGQRQNGEDKVLMLPGFAKSKSDGLSNGLVRGKTLIGEFELTNKISHNQIPLLGKCRISSANLLSTTRWRWE